MKEGGRRKEESGGDGGKGRKGSERGKNKGQATSHVLIVFVLCGTGVSFTHTTFSSCQLICFETIIRTRMYIQCVFLKRLTFYIVYKRGIIIEMNRKTQRNHVYLTSFRFTDDICIMRHDPV